MFLKTAFPFLAALTLLSLAGSAWADGEHGTQVEATVYASREADAPALQEFSGGLLGGVLAAIVAFVSDAVEAIVGLFCGDDEPETWPPNEQSRSCPDGLPVPA
jgi:hypothetical protein